MFLLPENSQAKPFDAFISYASADRVRARRLVHDLEARGARIWIDASEILPGDRLRDKINAGLASSQFFLVLLTKTSVQSRWVQVELDAAMIAEIESRRVFVIPVILDSSAKAQMPPDIRGKAYVDLSEDHLYDGGLQQLIARLQPEKRERAELLAILRSAAAGYETNEQCLLNRGTYQDQTIQKAALSGLAELNTPACRRLLFLRLISIFGLTTIKHCIKLTMKLGPSDGLLILAATLRCDRRLLWEKVYQIERILVRHYAGRHSVAEALQFESDGLDAKESNAIRAFETIYSLAMESDLERLKHGAILSAAIEFGSVDRGAGIALPSREDVAEAARYFKSRIPGAFGALACYDRLPSYFVGSLWYEAIEDDSVTSWEYSTTTPYRDGRVILGGPKTFKKIMALMD